MKNPKVLIIIAFIGIIIASFGLGGLVTIEILKKDYENKIAMLENNLMACEQLVR